MATIYMHQVCDECEDILGKLAKEDHISKQTELEVLISQEYKRRQYISTTSVTIGDIDPEIYQQVPIQSIVKGGTISGGQISTT